MFAAGFLLREVDRIRVKIPIFGGSYFGVMLKFVQVIEILLVIVSAVQRLGQSQMTMVIKLYSQTKSDSINAYNYLIIKQ